MDSPVPNPKGIPFGNSNAAGITRARKYYIFLVAIDHYPAESNLKPLNNPVYDANNVLSVLKRKFDFDIPENGSVDLREKDPRYTSWETQIPVYNTDDLRVKCLYNDQATRSEITKHIDNVAKKIEEDDAFFIYFSGHGAVKETGEESLSYVLPYNAIDDDDLTRWLPQSDLYKAFTRFNRLNSNKKSCRDFILILDCCYSGAVLLGQAGDIQAGIFSRYALMSCGPDRLAYDGEKWKGSPFANALCEVLELTDSTGKFKSIEFDLTSIVEDIRVKVQLKTNTKQNISYGPLPVTEQGGGAFVFALRPSEKPDINQLGESLVDYLDFKKIRGDLNDYYSDESNYLNIIFTRVPDFDTQKLLTKVMFRWLSNPLTGKIRFEKGVMLPAIEIKTSFTDAVWDILFNQIKDDQSPLKNEPQAIFNWFFEKLQGDEGKMHHVIHIRFDKGADQLSEKVRSFSLEWAGFYSNRWKDLSTAERESLSKQFIIFSDERESSNDFLDDAFFSRAPRPFNLIKTSRVGNIYRNDVVDWRGIVKNSTSKKLKDLEIKVDNPFDPFCPEDGFGNYELKLHDFIKTLAKYCEYNAEDARKLAAYVFNFESKEFLKK